MIEAKPEKLIGDEAYGSNRLDVELQQEGIEMIAPTSGAGSSNASLLGCSGNGVS